MSELYSSFYTSDSLRNKIIKKNIGARAKRLLSIGRSVQKTNKIKNIFDRVFMAIAIEEHHEKQWNRVAFVLKIHLTYRLMLWI